MYQKINFYLSSNEEIMNTLKFYLTEKSRKGEDIEYQKRLLNELGLQKRHHKQILDNEELEERKKLNAIRNKADKERSKISDHYDKLIDKHYYNEVYTRRFVLIALFMIVICSFLFDWGVTSYALIAIPIWSIYMKYNDPLQSTKVDNIRNEYTAKCREIEAQKNTEEDAFFYHHSNMKNKSKGYNESTQAIEYLDDKCQSILSTIDNIQKEINNLPKNFNIPKEIRGYEATVLDLFIKRRVQNFNEALDKVELYKHRARLEKMQDVQIKEIEEAMSMINSEINTISSDLYNKLNSQRDILNELKKLANQANESAREAAYNSSCAADSASYAASTAKKAANRASEAAYNSNSPGYIYDPKDGSYYLTYK